jgi:hypothetical protein
MDLKMKKRLLEKYWNGESTPEEEQWLKQQMTADDSWLSPEERRYFEHLQAFEQLAPEEYFDSSLFPETSPKEAKIVRRPFYRRITNIAVIALLLFTTGMAVYFWPKAAPPIVATTEVEEYPPLAFDMARASLLLVSQKMNKITKHLAALEKIELAHDKIQQKSIDHKKSKIN